MKYGVMASSPQEALSKLHDKVTLVDDMDPDLDPKPERKFRCTNCEEEGHGRNKCPHPIKTEIHFCLYCGRRDHREEDDCPQAIEDAEFKKNRPPTPCETCGGWHKGECKMG